MAFLLLSTKQHDVTQISELMSHHGMRTFVRNLNMARTFVRNLNMASLRKIAFQKELERI